MGLGSERRVLPDVVEVKAPGCVPASGPGNHGVIFAPIPRELLILPLAEGSVCKIVAKSRPFRPSIWQASSGVAG